MRLGPKPKGGDRMGKAGHLMVMASWGRIQHYIYGKDKNSI
jgi:hypothetical protein